MDDPIRPGAGGDRRLILAAVVALSLVLGGIAYKYSGDLIGLASSVTSGQSSRAQGRIHY